MRRILNFALCVLLTVAPAAAQVTGPAYVFVDGTTARADEVNTNFSTVYDNALNRLGGTMQGHLLFAPSGTYDILNPRDLALTRNATIGGTLTVSGTATLASLALTTLACTGCVDAAQLAATTVNPGIYGSGSSSVVGSLTVDADGRVTSATTLNASAITGIAEAGITDGTLLARVGGTETITASWTHQALLRVTGTTGQGASGSGLEFAGGFASPVIGRIFIGDGTGYRLMVSSRASSTTTDHFGFYDSGLFTAGSVSANTLSITSAFTFPTGSASVPSIAFTSDTDTGFYLDTNRACVTASGTSIFCTDATLGIIPTGSMKWAGNFLPSATGSWTLGRADLRFSEAWVTAGAFNSSDSRLKKNITPTALGLDFINQLRPVEYDWINPKLPGHYYGFIAQDLLALGFQAVDTSNPDEYGLRYTDLLAPMVKAMQELAAKVEALEAR